MASLRGYACVLAMLLTTTACGSLPLRGPALGGAAASAAAGSGGDRLPVRPGVGFLFERYRAPIDTDVSSTTLGSKEGRATTVHIRDPLFTQLPIITYGEADRDMATVAAAQAGGITRVDLVEVERFSVLGIYVRETIVVLGD